MSRPELIGILSAIVTSDVVAFWLGYMLNDRRRTRRLAVLGARQLLDIRSHLRKGTERIQESLENNPQQAAGLFRQPQFSEPYPTRCDSLLNQAIADLVGLSDETIGVVNRAQEDLSSLRARHNELRLLFSRTPKKSDRATELRDYRHRLDVCILALNSVLRLLRPLVGRKMRRVIDQAGL